MPNIRSIDMLFLDDLFEMGSGYVLNLSNPAFSRFFAEELNVDIDDPTYAENGTSKGRRLRCFLQKVEVPAVVKTLKALWEYREAIRMRDGIRWLEHRDSADSFGCLNTILRHEQRID